MSDINDKQLEEICNLIHEAAHLLTLNDAVDLELFKMNSGFEWGLNDRQSCQPNNIVNNFIRLLEDAKTANNANSFTEGLVDKEYSQVEVLEQLKSRISPLYDARKKLNPDDASQMNTEKHRNNRV